MEPGLVMAMEAPPDRDREVDARLDPNWSEETRAIVERIQREWERYEEAE